MRRAAPGAALPKGVSNILSPIFRLVGGSAQNRHLGSGFQGSRKISTIHAISGILLGSILVVILIVFLLGGFSGRFGGYVSKEEGTNSSDTPAVRQFDTNSALLISVPFTTFRLSIWIVRRGHVALQHLPTHM